MVNYELIIPLKHVSFYPGCGSLDMVFFLPVELRELPWPRDKARLLELAKVKKTLRFWMMTKASKPLLQIDDLTFTPQKVITGPPRWLDMGTVSGIKGGFSQLRLQGMTITEAANSFLVITSQTKLELNGKIDEVERRLWGLSRRDAGFTMVSPSCAEVGKPVTFKVYYFASEKGLPSGSRVRFTVPLAFDAPQKKDPVADGFTYCESLNSGFPVKIEHIGLSSESHEAVDIVCLLPNGLPPRGGITLTYRTSKTYLFPCLFVEVERRYWYSKVPPLNTAVAVDQRGLFVPMFRGRGHAIKFSAGPPARLHLFLPGRRKLGARIILHGVWTDRYRNVPSAGTVPSARIFLIGPDGESELSPTMGHFTDWYRFEMRLPDVKPGIYRVMAREQKSGRVLATSNPMEILPLGSKEKEVFWGEIHAHTEMSDGYGGFSDLYQHARHIGCLDFAAASDHACYFTDNEWQWMQDVSNHWYQPGKFVTLIGYEWAGIEGHRCIYTSRERLPLFRGMYPPTSSLQTLWEQFGDDPEVAIGIHAPLSLGHELIWDPATPLESFAEVYSMWGADDSPGNSLAPIRLSPHGISVNELLEKGAHLGFTGGGDCHDGRNGFSSEDPARQGKVPHSLYAGLVYRCGMTAAFLEHLDRRSLIKALRTGKTYATTGARILLSFTICGAEIGEQVHTGTVLADVSVHGCAPIKRVEIVKDGRVIFSKDFNSLDVVINWLDPKSIHQPHFYYVRITQINGQIAWSSPIYVVPK